MTRLSALPATSSVAATDIFHLANAPSGANIDKKITAADLFLPYALLAGRSGGQTLIGGTASGNGLTLTSTSNATKGLISLDATLYVDGVNLRVGIGTNAPAQKLHIMNGNIRADQIAEASAPTVATGAAGVLTGAYIYVVTFVTATGETSANTTGFSSTVNPSSQQVALTNIPVSVDASVTSRKIYRTTAGGANTQMKLVTTIADNTTTTYNDNIADGSLGANMTWKNTTGSSLYIGTVKVASFDSSFLGINGIGITGLGGYRSTVFGTAAAGNLSTGTNNSAIGWGTLAATTTGSSNTAVGSASGVSISTGSNNTTVGQGAGTNNATGSQNTFVGAVAGTGVAANSHSNNTGVGYNAGGAITTGSQNIFLGRDAGSNLTTGSNNLIIGYNISAPSATASNQMNIGNLLFSAGIDGTTTTISSGSLGIGVAAPAARLHVMNGNIRADVIAEAGAPTVATGAAGVLTGAYQYSVTFVTAVGETSVNLGNLSSVVNPSSQQVALTSIPVSVDASVTSRKLYRTTAGGSTTAMKLVTTIADNTTTTYNDNIADGSLTTAMPSKNTTGGQFLTSGTRAINISPYVVAIGQGASAGLGGFSNVAIGTSALNVVTTGGQSVVIGYAAGSLVTTAGNSTFVGYTAGQNMTTGDANTIVGAAAGRGNQSGANNTWVGSQAGQGVLNNSNANNTGLGYFAGNAITTGVNNVYLGYRAGYLTTTGGSNLIIGYDIQTPAVGTSNFMSIGNLLFSAGINATGTSISTGFLGIGIAAPAQKLHVATGNIRMDQVASAGAPTTALNGAGALTGTYQYGVTFVTAVGETSIVVGNLVGTSISPSSQQVRLTNIPVSADAAVTSRKIYRTPAGGDFASLKLVTTIADNTTTTFDDNVADGSLTTNMTWKNTTGSNILQGAGRIFIVDVRHVAIGASAGNGTAIGGYDSVAIGTSALALVTTAIQNVAIGMQSGQNITTGSGNTLMGRAAGGGITTGASNTVLGEAAMQNNQTGSNNVIVGRQAGTGVASNSYNNNTILGTNGGTALTTGSNNVLLGYTAGNNLTTGSSNIIIGYTLAAPAVGTSNYMSIGNLIYSGFVDGTGTTASTGGIGIGAASPSAKLHVNAASQSASSWTTTGKIFAVDGYTVTDSTGSGTIAFRAMNSFGAPTIVAGSSETLTDSTNLYIAGAPVASTNVTQTRSYAMFIDTGAAGSLGLAIRMASSPTVAALRVYTNTLQTVFAINAAGDGLISPRDTATNSVTLGLAVGHQTSGTPAPNFGTSILIQGDSSNNTVREMARIRSIWNTATDGSRKAYGIISAYDTAERDVIGFGASGSAALLGFYPTIAAAPIAQPTTAGAAATFVANTSLIANDTATFDGYTIGQVVKALRNLGLLT